MVMSAAEREELIRRVSRRVTHPGVDAGLVRSAVERVAGAMERATAGGEGRLVVVGAESIPDLASRLRAALGAAEVRAMAVASEGRHTVVVARVDGRDEEAVRVAAHRIGARVVVRDMA